MSADGLSSEGQASERNVWQDLLAKTTQTAESKRTLLVLGSRDDGKSDLLRAFSGRVANADSKEYFLDYSFINVKNKRSAYQDEVIGRMDVWQAEEASHAQLLPELLLTQQQQHHERTGGDTASSALRGVVMLVTVDLSKPWEAVSTLRHWLAVAQQTSEAVCSRMDPGQVERHKDQVSKHVQFYGASEGGEDSAQVEVDRTIPEVNLGVHLLVVGCRADALSRALPQSDQKRDERFGFLLRELRTEAIKYGATLVYASEGGGSADVVQDCIFDHAYGFGFPHEPRVAVSADSHAVLVPAGYDSAALVEAAGDGEWKAGTTLGDVFAPPAKSSSGDKSPEPTVRAMDNNKFFLHLRKVQQQQGGGGGTAATPGSGASVLASSPARTKPSSSSSHSSSSASSALGGRASASPAASTKRRGAGSTTRASGTSAGAGSRSGTSAARAKAKATAGVDGDKDKNRQRAVKSFFKSLLDNKPGTAGGDAARTKRREAQHALRGMKKDSTAKFKDQV